MCHVMQPTTAILIIKLYILAKLPVELSSIESFASVVAEGTIHLLPSQVKTEE